MACCLDIWLLLVCITERIFVLIGSVQPLPYSRSLPMQQVHDQHRVSVRRYLIPASSFFMYNQEQRGDTHIHTLSSTSISIPASDIPQASPIDSRRVRWIQGTKYSIIVTFLINRHQGEFRLVWRHQS